MSEELTVEGAGSFHSQRIRKRSDLRDATIGFNVVHDTEKQWGSYRPLRNLPTVFTKGHHTDKEGYVFSQGKILGKYDRQVFDAGAWKYQNALGKLGVSNVTTGDFYAYRDVAGTPQTVSFADPVWGTSPDIVGFVGPFNGNGDTALVGNGQDLYTASDVAFGIIRPENGALVTAGGNASLRQAGNVTASHFEICGVALRDTMRETRNNHYQYARETEAFAVGKRGYITVPYVIAHATLAGTYTAADDETAFNLASVQRAASFDQTVLFVESADLLQSGNVVHVDAWGNPFLTSKTGAAEFPAAFGTVVDFTTVVTMPYGRYVQTYPELEIAGTGTGGVDHPLFYLARKLYPSSTVEAISAQLTGASANYFGYATIWYDLP